MSTGKVLIGLLTGVAVGTTLGILFAPDKGESTRKKITKQGTDLTDSLVSRFNGLMDRMSSKIDSIKDEVHQTAQNGKAEARDAMNEVAAAAKAKLH
jgi:gas vesicle protein